MIEKGYTIRQISKREVHELCEKYHGYGGAGNAMVYAFGVVENGEVVAAYAWQPPAPGAARSICPECPQGVLALSRMVAVPKDRRALNHISKPLRYQMRHMIDRSRWPVLVTYSDSGQGHTGHVYKCSGWQKTSESDVPFYINNEGVRTSYYSNGVSGGRNLVKGGITTITRWEHWGYCPKGLADAWMGMHGWRRVPVEGKTWRSGNQAYTYKKI